MIPIVIVSKEKTVKQLTEILRQFFVVSITTDYKIEIDNKCDILLISVKEIKDVRLNNGILILSDSCEKVLEECSCPIVIADGSKSLQCEKISSKTQYITCGMNAKDTISFSSIDVDEVSVSLMRELKRLNGEPVEPFEVTLCSKTNIANYSAFSMLCAVALISVLGVTTNSLKLCLE